MAWTNEQLQAINLDNSNILVSAGAGSGKTAVLTERVKRKVLSGVHVDELLVLTFTNAASQEMKSRIRQAIIDTGLTDEANLVDSSYITTFDSFALSIVKKYHTNLNVSNNIQITDEVIIDMKKRELLSEIFDSYYKKPTKEFSKLINDFCLKDDLDLKEYLLKAYKKIELKYDKSSFLNNYFSIFDENKMKGFVNLYEEFLNNKKESIILLIDQLSNYFEDDFVLSFKNNYKKFIEANTYNEYLLSMDYGTVRVPRGSSEEGKQLKESIVELIKEFKNNYCLYDSIEDILKELLLVQDTIKTIVEILIRFDRELEDYKYKEQIFNFTDIARMAIKVVEENIDIREELTRKFKEIMVDEYQDTSDIQEKFISLISNNNVYMVGDVKQSIYRFRNANPDIFRIKYDNYRNTNEGIVIDLLKNFRSREEVLSDVNLIFNPIMDDYIGGAAYKEYHQMVFGNLLYDTLGKTNDNHHMDIITYNKKELKNIRDYEEEAFIICEDIKNKVDAKYQVWDKDLKVLRPVSYKDFVILLDRSTQFDTYKKIFEYFHIPLNVLKDYSFQNSDDSLILKNLIKLIICIYENRLDSEFEYSFISIARSFLYKMNDDEIYEYYLNKNYKDSNIYKDCFELSLRIDYESTSQFVKSIFKEINYDERILCTSNIYDKRVREEFFYNLAKSLEEKGKTIFDFVLYLEEVFSGDYDLKYSISESDFNSCTIMTIHKSKGLEFPICYYAGFGSGFNLRELNERIIFDNEFGFIIPFVNGYYKDTILKVLLKRRVRLEEISEKLRLLYVALTRSKEKMIFVLPNLEDNCYNNMVPNYIREKYSSFLSVFNSISTILLPYCKESKIIATKDYLMKKELEKVSVNNSDSFTVNELDYVEQSLLNKHYSKDELHLYEAGEKELLELGTKVHEILEVLDFNNRDLLNNISNSFIKSKVLAFLNSSFMSDKIDKKMYKEYEFIYEKDFTSMHGIIDLLIDMESYYVIVDYKLKNIDDLLYIKQLDGYRKYIEEVTNKKCKCYLYSIIDEVFKECHYD